MRKTVAIKTKVKSRVTYYNYSHDSKINKWGTLWEFKQLLQYAVTVCHSANKGSL